MTVRISRSSLYKNCTVKKPFTPSLNYAFRRSFSNQSSNQSSHHRSWVRPSSTLFAAVAAVALVYNTVTVPSIQAEAPSIQPEVLIEKSKKKKGASKEENRDLISSQHLQVKKSWENPGVYAWGSNSDKVAAPESDEIYIKTPRRIRFFDDQLLRDIKLDRNFGAAILENGDLVQWGKGFSVETSTPIVTLKGRDLTSITISRDRVVALSKNGKVYSIPVSKLDQENGNKPSENSWIPFMSNKSKISYRSLEPRNLGYNERVTAISGGLDHVILLTNAGRVFTAASATESFPSRGQLGVPGITWHSRPEGPFDMCHEVMTLKGFDIQKIAAGDTHSVVLDKEGRIFTFGDNSSGQLGFNYNSEAPYVDTPSLLPLTKLYQGTNLNPKVTSIAAGGTNTFFTVDATRITGPDENPSEIKDLGRITADTWSCGQGIKGSLGTGKWSHYQDIPTKIPSLSGLFEFDEKKNIVIPIRLARISVGSNHVSAVMKNVTYLDANERGSENDTNWGADVLWWGSNEFYQLGTGKRNNVNNPQYIRPLDMSAEIEAGRKEEHRFHATPMHSIRVNGRKVKLEQRIECGRNVTAVYSAV